MYAAFMALDIPDSAQTAREKKKKRMITTKRKLDTIE